MTDKEKPLDFGKYPYFSSLSERQGIYRKDKAPTEEEKRMLIDIIVFVKTHYKEDDKP